MKNANQRSHTPENNEVLNSILQIHFQARLLSNCPKKRNELLLHFKNSKNGLNV